MDQDPRVERYAEMHRKFLEDNNPAVLKGMPSSDRQSYLSSVGEQANSMFLTLMRQYKESLEKQKVPHLQLVQSLQSHRHEAEEVVLHDVIFQPLPETD